VEEIGGVEGGMWMEGGKGVEVDGGEEIVDVVSVGMMMLLTETLAVGSRCRVQCW
jgi:hypothetical protein